MPKSKRKQMADALAKHMGMFQKKPKLNRKRAASAIASSMGYSTKKGKC